VSLFGFHVRSFVTHYSSDSSEGIHTTIVVSTVNVRRQRHANSVEELADVKINGRRRLLDMTDDEMVSVVHAMNIEAHLVTDRLFQRCQPCIVIPSTSARKHRTTVGHALLQDIC
jgi:hypothetical protein